MKIRIGTRGSQLALWQAKFVKSALESAISEIEVELCVIKTEGDIDLKSSLTEIGGQGVFTKAIENALIDNKVDIAVHSLKDLATTMDKRLVLACIPQKVAAEDVLVTQDGKSWKELPYAAKVATGSIRRRSQLLALRPDLKMVDLRGNIATRLEKLSSQNLDGIIMAKAALDRLELYDVKYSIFSVDEMLPGVSQGAIGIQCRTEDDIVIDTLESINNKSFESLVIAERAFLRRLDTGCQFPVGAYAKLLDDNTISLSGFVGNEDGTIVIREKMSAPVDHAYELGENLAESYLKQGAAKLLKI